MNNQQNPIDVLSNALDKSNRAGVFGIAESHAIFQALVVIAEKLNEAEASKDPAKGPKIKPMGDPKVTPHPGGTPFDPKP